MPKQPSKTVQLQKQLMQSQAQDIMRLANSHREMLKTGQDKYMASGLILSIKNLSGDMIIPDTMIADGLSADTIAAIRADIQRTYDMRLACNKIA